ncbi:MAG TPA: hypothetical protein VHG91_19830, partial [Longimicrobium sp.]|nr:hypothetical protein [Longimicrobium sp.]
MLAGSSRDFVVIVVVLRPGHAVVVVRTTGRRAVRIQPRHAQAPVAAARTLIASAPPSVDALAFPAVHRRLIVR